MNTRFGSFKLKDKMSNRLCERVCGHRGRFWTRAGSGPCVFQASRRQSWAFVSSGSFLGETLNLNRIETGFFFDLGMPSTSCIFDVGQTRTRILGSSACSEASSLFPESVWAKGSSNSGVLSNIFTSSHLQIFKSSHLLILTSSHIQILTSSHLHILTSSHLLIFISSHLHICSSSHLHIFSSSHLLILTSSHPHIFTSSHLHIFSSSHLLIFSSSHPQIFPSSHLHIFSSSHLLIFTSAHLLIFTSSHLHIFSSSHSLLPPCSLAPWLSLLSCVLLLFYFSLEGAGQCQRDGTKRNPFARNEVRSPKTKVKLRFAKRPAQLFRTKWGSIAKN